jgi:hypothetical protein
LRPLDQQLAPIAQRRNEKRGIRYGARETPIVSSVSEIIFTPTRLTVP